MPNLASTGIVNLLLQWSKVHRVDTNDEFTEKGPEEGNPKDCLYMQY